ncbi:hypothetical protein ACFQ7A_04855 [Streptomyces sp. NPDC056528]|uniref:hypothetical protein n=1 Tax=Streptomyces sp. NPDC056528 TaxID=3345854 RepID=UPI0036B92D80
MARPYGSRDAEEREYVPPVRDKKRKGLVRLSPMVPPEVHEAAYANAKAAGVSMGKYLAALIQRDQLDTSGRPVWANEAFGQSDQGQLPMTG